MKTLDRNGRHPVRLTLNGMPEEGFAEPRMLLTDFLRHEIGATGTHVACEHGVCGACTVRIGGKAVRACLMLAVQANGAEVETIEGLCEADGSFGLLQQAFHENFALQCGYCTPGFLMSLSEYLEKNPRSDGRGDQGRAERQPVSLHRLSRNHQRRPGRREGAPGAATIGLRGTMRAVLVNEFGPVESHAIADLPDPEPGPGEVLIEKPGHRDQFPGRPDAAGPVPEAPAPALRARPRLRLASSSRSARASHAASPATGSWRRSSPAPSASSCPRRRSAVSCCLTACRSRTPPP